MDGGFFDFSAKKSVTQALLLYVLGVVAAAVVVGVCTVVIFPPSPEALAGHKDFSTGFARGAADGEKIGPYFNVVFSLLLSLLSIRAKNLHTPKGIGCALVGAVLGYFAGSVGGMILPAYLTTQPALKES